MEKHDKYNRCYMFDKSTQLLKAARTGDVELIIRLVVFDKIDPNPIDEKGYTPLMLAAKNGHYIIVLYLTEAKANLDHADKEGHTALMLAAKNGHSKIALHLVKTGANIDKETPAGWTALLLAMFNKHYEVVSQLLKADADISWTDSEGKNLLDYANAIGDKWIISLIQECIKETQKAVVSFFSNTSAQPQPGFFRFPDGLANLVNDYAMPTLNPPGFTHK